jgi:L-alanine-DL-glutamate epimerase-like enolase superfamily enzyme
MKITALELLVLEDPDSSAYSLELVEVPGLLRSQYTHRSQPAEGRIRQNFLRVISDEGPEGMCTTTMNPTSFQILKNQVLGSDPFQREYLYQKLSKGTRWVYQTPGWFGDFDNCLWDIAGKAADLPVYALVGRARDRFPVYLTGGDMDIEGYLKHIELGRSRWGVNAYKFHSYKGGKADIPILQTVREAVGPDYVLINDPVCSYTLREAIEVGHVMEELDFIWLEEPFHEQKMHHYQELCRELTIPVMSNEMLMHDIGLSTQWLLHGATDRLRANARNGTTQVLKMAHFAELYDTNIELNGHGGLFGLVHAHLGCCIDNTDYYEMVGGEPRPSGQRWGILNAPEIIDGHMVPPDGPGWGAEWDMDRFNRLVVERY